MAEPKKRLTSARSGARRAHLRATKPTLNRCNHCRSLKPDHQVCMVCGYYRGVKVLEVGKKVKKEAKR